MVRSGSVPVVCALALVASFVHPLRASAWSFESWDDLGEPLDAIEVDVPPPTDPSSTGWSQRTQVELALCPSGDLYQFRSTRIGLFGEWRDLFGQTEFVWVTVERRRIEAPILDPTAPTTVGAAEAALAAGSTWTVAAKNVAALDSLVVDASCAQGTDGAEVLLWRGDRGDVGTVGVYETGGGFAVLPGPSRYTASALPAGAAVPPPQLVLRSFDGASGAALTGFTPSTGAAETLFFSGTRMVTTGPLFSAPGASILASSAEDAGRTYLAAYPATFAMGREGAGGATTLTIESPRSSTLAAQTGRLAARASGLDVQRTPSGVWVVLRTRAPGAAAYRARITP